MSALINLAGSLKTYLEQVGTYTDGLASDVRNYQAALERLKTSKGTGKPEGQQALGELKTIGEAMTQKINALNEVYPPSV